MWGVKNKQGAAGDKNKQDAAPAGSTDEMPKSDDDAVVKGDQAGAGRGRGWNLRGGRGGGRLTRGA